jgi:hypothetical protein
MSFYLLIFDQHEQSSLPLALMKKEEQSKATVRDVWQNIYCKKYGRDSIEMIVSFNPHRQITLNFPGLNANGQFDEGIAGHETHWGSEFVLPATAEKGYVDVVVRVDVAGGHSSTPPDHTASESVLTLRRPYNNWCLYDYN